MPRRRVRILDERLQRRSRRWFSTILRKPGRMSLLRIIERSSLETLPPCMRGLFVRVSDAPPCSTCELTGASPERVEVFMRGRFLGRGGRPHYGPLREWLSRGGFAAAGLLRGARRRPQAAEPMVSDVSAGGQPVARPARERSDRPVETVPAPSKMRTTSTTSPPTWAG